MICALAIGYLKENSRIKEDTVMGVVFSGMFGLGIVLYTKIQTDVHLDHILFGDMLGVAWRDVIADRPHRRVLRRRRSASKSARPAAAHLRPAARAGHRPAGPAAALRPAGAAVADHRRRAEGGRHHPGHRPADRARRHRLSADHALRPRCWLFSVAISVAASLARRLSQLLHRQRAGADHRAPSERDLRGRFPVLAAADCPRATCRRAELKLPRACNSPIS